jgi:hypothetical protein
VIPPIFVDTVRFLHVLGMATWLAASLWLAADAKAALALGPDAVRSYVRRGRTAVRLDQAAGVFTILTGVCLVHFANTWPHLRHGLWLGIALAVVRAGLVGALVSPSLRRMGAALEAGQPLASLQPLAARLALGSRLGHAAWLGALAGMLFRS